MISPIIRHPLLPLPPNWDLPWLYALNPLLPRQENPIYNWILQYQRMLSTSEAALAFYHSLLTDPQLLANGYNLVKQFLFAGPLNRSHTLVALLHPSVPVLALVLNIYPTEVFTSEAVSPQEKQETRQFLANLLASELLKDSEVFNAKNVELLFSFLHKIHNVEGFHEWVPLYEQTLQRLVENQSNRFGFFLLNLLRGADDRVGEFAQHVVGLVVGSQWVPNPEEQLQILYDCYRSLAILNDTDPDSIDKYVSGHIDTTISYISANMRRSVRAMKFSLKILTLLFGDYQVPCSKELLQGVEDTGRALIEQYINYLNRGCSEGANSDIQLEQQEGDIDPIQIALYQLIELFLTLYGNQTKINSELCIYLCLTATFLSQQQSQRYATHSDQYVSEIEDEGEVSLRNKAVYFMQEILQNEKQGKKCRKMLQQYVQDVLANTNNIVQFLTNYALPTTLLKHPQLYLQSALLLLYSFTEQLAQNEKQVSAVLAGIVQNSAACSIQPILAVSVLNKLVKKQQGFKNEYLVFLRAMTAKFTQNIGMLMVLMRGLYSFSSQEQLAISQQGKTVPLHMVRNLLAYLSRNDSAQLQSGHLIIEFLLHLLKHIHNKIPLQQLAPTQTQLYLLRTYIHDGITSQLIIDLIAELSDQQTIAVVLNQVAQGHAHDESLPNLVAKCITNRALSLTEEQLAELCRIYSKKLQIISDILVAYLQLSKPQNQQLINILNSNLSPRWLAHLIRYDLLFNIQDSFLSCVQNITVSITSPSELENQLVLPFSIILRNPQQALALLAQQQLFPSFCNKLYQYAKLFKGVHLRITTLNVFAAISSIHREWIRKTVQLFDSYGTIESNQWQDEDEDEEGIINKYFSGVVNEQVEKTFKATFGELSWDSAQVSSKIAHLRQMI